MNDILSSNLEKIVDLAAGTEMAQPAATIMSESPATVSEMTVFGSLPYVGLMWERVRDRQRPVDVCVSVIGFFYCEQRLTAF